ncbi:uncharacterized protein [Amphiura filiformis]|uniref:uncharacterized protein n=1 Tax=Amphiura filiformis TaxID=82378 RepID=UPI003B20C086
MPQLLKVNMMAFLFVAIVSLLQMHLAQSQGNQDFLTFSTSTDLIYTSNLTCLTDLEEVEITPSMTMSNVRGVDYDPVDEKLYVVSRDTDQILRFNLDGTGGEILVSPQNPWGITLDTSNRIVYFTQTGAVKGIQYINMDGTGQGSIASSDFQPRNGRALAFGSVTQLIYIGWSKKGSQIRRYSHDGTTTDESLIAADDDIIQPWAMTVNEMEHKLYWTDALLNKLEVYDLQTKTRTVLSDEGTGPYSGVAEYGGFLYYAAPTLRRMAINGLNDTEEEITAGTPKTYLVKYESGMEQSYTCGPLIDLSFTSYGPVCEGRTVCVDITNNGDSDGIITVSTDNGTAIEGEDYTYEHAIEETIIVTVNETVSYTFNILADQTEETDEKHFSIMLTGSVPMISRSTNRTGNITISEDYFERCDYGPYGFDDYDGCGPAINFESVLVGPVCEGILPVRLTNIGGASGSINVVSINDTAESNTNFREVNETLNVGIGQFVKFDVEIINHSDSYDTTEKLFHLQLVEDNGEYITYTRTPTVNVTVQCDVKHVEMLNIWKGGFMGRVSFIVGDYDVTNWRVVLHFDRRVWGLKLIDCGDVKVGGRVVSESGDTAYTLVPIASRKNVVSGHKVLFEFSAKTEKRPKDMQRSAVFEILSRR